MKHWSTTQASISLSSGEAEFNGVVRGAGHALGYQSLLRDLGVDLPIRLWTDSSAAIGICSRQGLGKIRHLDTHTLWVQQAVRMKRIELRKVRGEVNPADVFTKHSLTRDRLRQLVELFDCYFKDGRAESAPQLRRTATSKVKISEADVGDQVCDANLWHVGVLGLREDGPGPLCFPHSTFSKPRLDELYPPLDVPEQLDIDDVHRDAFDLVYQRGLAEAQAIQASSEVFGRMKRASLRRDGGPHDHRATTTAEQPQPPPRPPPATTTTTESLRPVAG